MVQIVSINMASRDNNVLYLLHGRQSRTEPRQQVTRTDNFTIFGHCGFWHMHADRQTDTQTRKAQYFGQYYYSQLVRIHS